MKDNQEPGDTIAAAGRPSKKRKMLFKAISIFIPFLFLGLVEISLRVFHYGHDTSLFIAYTADKDFLVMNPDASKKYFTNQAIATTGNIEPFKKEKDKNTIRIFILGESTTIGYPYFHNGSFHRWLQFRLMQSMPEKNFEIINVSLTAVNSYTVLGFAKELVNYQPDAVLIYTGHNEYYGALGAGATDKVSGNRTVVNLMLGLRRLRLVQLMTNGYEKIGRVFAGGQSKSGKTRMELMVADQQIAYGSKLFDRGVEQFRSNMDATLALFNTSHIPVFVSNLVSNEKDLKPFAPLPADSTHFPAFKEKYTAGITAFEKNDLDAAEKLLVAANRIYNAHALCNYYLGRIAWIKHDFNGAKKYFSKAKDLDGLRFRAPGQMNEIILQLCNKYQYAHLVDTKAAFEAASPNNIIGGELILEHVHPNLAGYALMSDVFYKAIKKERVISISDDKEMSFKHLITTMPITKVDSLTGVYKIEKLKRSWPFSEEQAVKSSASDSVVITSEEEKLAYAIAYKQLGWQQANDQLYDYYISKHDLENAKTVVGTMVLEHPAEAAYYEKAANLCGELKDYDNALFYFKKAFALAPSFDKARYLFVIYLKLDRPADAIPYLDYGINNTASGTGLVPLKILAGEIVDLKKQYSKDSMDIPLLNQIAIKYFRMGNEEGASKYLQKALRADSKNKDALSLLSQIKIKQDAAHH